jgi:hypothetical protein
MASDRGVEAGHGGRIMVGRVLVEALMRAVIVITRVVQMPGHAWRDE